MTCADIGRRIARGVLATSLLTAALACAPAAGRSASFPYTERTASHILPPHTVGVTRDLRPRSDSIPVAALTTLHDYVTAFAHGHYLHMWQLVTPAARQDWADETQYESYYRAKFAPVRLVRVDVGAPRRIGTAITAPVTLDLTWRAPGPPRVLSLFKNVDASVMPVGRAWRVSGAGPLDPEAPIIPPPHPAPTALHVPILMYHHISNTPPPAPSQVGLTVTTRAFAAQLAYLAGQGYHAVRLTDLFNRLYYGRSLPPRPVILTFDDGYADNYTDAFPMLRRYHLTAEFAVITALPGSTLGVNRYMTWTQIKAMAAAGMDMESHTVDHADLNLVTNERADYEVHFSHAVLAWYTRHPVQFFTYPSGEPFRHGDAWAQGRIVSLLQRYGYVGALLDPITPGTRQNAQEPYQLDRVRVEHDESLSVFAARLKL